MADGKIRTSGTDVAESKGTQQRVSLKSVARYLGLSTTTVSVVVNGAPAASAISQETKDRILKAAQKLNYRPNYFARSLRQQRTFMVAMLLPEISEGYAASIMRGIEDWLLKEGYFYFVVSHRGKLDLIDEYAHLLIERGVEGLICLNTPVRTGLSVPVVTISGERRVAGVTNIAVDNRKAVRQALEHLVNLGHKQIAFFKGHVGSADTEIRWDGICKAARELGVEVRPELTVQLARRVEGEPSTPDEGYFYGQELLARKQHFTALLAFNDMSAIGAMRAFQDHGLCVPRDVSIVGFDDIQAAAFNNPRLTTVRQPMRRMGEIAATTLLSRITNPDVPQKNIKLEPELVVRESTGRARQAIAAHT